MTHFESFFIAMKYVLGFGGWMLAGIASFFLYGTRKEIKGLKESVEILKQDRDHQMKGDSLRDKFIQDLAEIISDEKMTQANRKRIEDMLKRIRNANNHETNP